MPEMHLLTGAYALDALDDVERAGYERHLRSCGSCAAEVIEFQEAVAGLADRVATEPPVHLRAAVLAEVSRTRQVSLLERHRLRRPSLRRSLATAAAAVVIAGGAGLAGVAWQGQQSAQESQDIAASAQARAAELTRVLLDPSRQEAVQAPSVGGVATVVAARGKAVLATDRMPAPPSGTAYQAWVISKSAVITSRGLLTLTDGTAQTLMDGVSKGDTVAISVEPAGTGSRQPTTTPVVMIEVA